MHRPWTKHCCQNLILLDRPWTGLPSNFGSNFAARLGLSRHLTFVWIQWFAFKFPFKLQSIGERGDCKTNIVVYLAASLCHTILYHGTMIYITPCSMSLKWQQQCGISWNCIILLKFTQYQCNIDSTMCSLCIQCQCQQFAITGCGSNSSIGTNLNKLQWRATQPNTVRPHAWQHSQGGRALWRSQRWVTTPSRWKQLLEHFWGWTATLAVPFFIGASCAHLLLEGWMTRL